ncbi:gliding motility-associated C-terminal domain-containing protein [bacterium]|nr:gliding motility-associated C-terminal domain-containing protein [bacterium]
MSYSFVTKLPNGNYRYLVRLNLYRDCFQSDVPLDETISIGVYLAGQAQPRLYTAVDFDLVTKREVDPPGSVDCDFYAKNVCIEFGYYQGTIDLPPRVDGYDIVFERCCRNRQTNILDDGSDYPDQGQTYTCHIPSHLLENNSAMFSGVPSPYMCANDTTTFNFTAIDPDGDELVYRLVHPYQGASIANSAPAPEDPMEPIKNVIYSSAQYNAQNPFGRFNGSIADVDAATGLTTFMSPNQGSYVVAIEVAEVRDGDTISRVRLDLQILVLNCPPNERPIVKALDGDEFTIEAGSTLCFDISATDPDDDFVKLTAEGIMLDGTNGFTGTRATFNPDNGSPTATGEFCWDTDCDHFRDEPYIVTVQAEDDGCPPKFNTIDILITVTPFVGADEIDYDPRACRYNTYTYSAVGGQPNSTYEWTVQNGTIIGPNDEEDVQVRWDGAASGSVSMTEISEHGCRGDTTTVNITISESPETPEIQGKDTVCINEMNLDYSVDLNNGNTYDWWLNGGTIGSENQNEIEIGTYNNTGFTVFVTETNDIGCTSDTAIKEVYVSNPLPSITGPLTVCPNAQDVIYLTQNNSGSNYNWTVSGGTISSGDGTNEIEIDWGNVGPGSVTVFETDRHGCTGNATIVIEKTYQLDAVPIFGPDEVCEDELNVRYFSDDVNGATYLWNVNGGTQTSGDSTFEITVDWGAPGQGSVGIQQKAYDLVNNRVCLSPVFTMDVTINPKPTADEILGPVELCQYSDSATYTINGFANSTFEWTVGGANSYTGQGTNSITVYWSESGTFTISVKETTDAGCENLTIDTTILVNPAPVTTDIVGPTIVCPENALSNVYSVTGFPTSTYTWFVNGERTFTGQGTNTITVDWEPTVPFGKVRVVETTDKGCSGDTLELDVEIDRLAIDMRVISVGTPDNRMYINWQLTELSTSSGFTIQKRVKGETIWQDVIELPGNVFEYTEQGINTDLDAFEYRVIALNKCGNLVSSEEHTNILLIGSLDEQLDINITFFDYEGWDNGVRYYELYESTNDGPYYAVQTGVQPEGNILVENDINVYRQCYRVFATEEAGENTVSWSNEICFTFDPSVYVPNAFTPNDDDLNDQLGVVGLAIKEYHIEIYNRWGEKLFESDNIDENWDAIYRGNPVQQGTYVYVITYTDFEDKPYTRTGTVHVLR